MLNLVGGDNYFLRAISAGVLQNWNSLPELFPVLADCQNCSMTQVTPEEIAQFRAQLADYPDAIAALEEIEECEGDLEDAAMVLAIRAGQQPDIANSEWLAGLAKKCRAAICQSEFRTAMVKGNFAPVIEHLAARKLCPPLLVTPVLMYVFQQGVNKFCEPLDSMS